MKNNWKLPDCKRREAIAVIQGHRERKANFEKFDGQHISYDVMNEMRKLNAVSDALKEATSRIKDETEARYVMEWLLLNLENKRQYPYKYCNTKLTEFQFFDMQYKFIYLTSLKLSQ